MEIHSRDNMYQSLELMQYLLFEVPDPKTVAPLLGLYDLSKS